MPASAKQQCEVTKFKVFKPSHPYLGRVALLALGWYQ